jgi:hypothetical protein
MYVYVYMCVFKLKKIKNFKKIEKTKNSKKIHRGCFQILSTKSAFSISRLLKSGLF